MNIFCLIASLWISETERTLEIPQHFIAPVVTWEDLNGDGVLDIWLKDFSGRVSEQVWVWDGATAETLFQQVAFEPIGLEVRPVFVQGAWHVQAYDRGILFLFQEETGWIGVEDLNRLTRIRPGMEPINRDGQSLIATFDGYWLVEGACVRNRLEALPSIELDAKTLSLTYPIPTWRDLDDDGEADLTSAPIIFPQQGELGIWTALAPTWETRWSRMRFPDGLDMMRHGLGDLDGDGWDDLVVLAMPGKDISVFEELSFVVYMGTGPGSWNPQAVQVLKTKQNLWQQGPLEVGPRGIFFFYHKGLFRSHFKIDLFGWNPAGFIEPRPQSLKWRLQDADDNITLVDHDVNGDGQKDLILSDRNGIHVHYRKVATGIPFHEKPDRILAATQPKVTNQGQAVSLSMGGASPPLRMSTRDNQLRGEGGSIFIADRVTGKTALWTLYEGLDGHWYLSESF